MYCFFFYVQNIFQVFFFSIYKGCLNDKEKVIKKYFTFDTDKLHHNQIC